MRFLRLLSEGLASSELKNFFEKNKSKLMLAGEGKLQNLPRDRAAALQMLIKMKEKAFRIFEQGYRNAYVTDGLKPPLDVAIAYKEYLESEIPPEPDTIRSLAGMVLYHLFSDDCPNELLSIFKRAPSDKSIVARNGGGQDETPPTVQLNEVSLAELRELIVHMVGLTPQDVSTDLQKNSYAFVSALAALQKRDVRLARQHQQSMPEDDRRFSLVEDAIDQVLIEIESAARNSKGLHLQQMIMRSRSDEFDPETSEIVGHCKGSHNGTDSTPSFIEVIGVWAGDQLFTYPEDVLKDCLPESGELIAYENNRSVERPFREEVGVWTVERIEHSSAAMKIQYRLKRRAKDVFEIFDIPHTSDDYDAFREAVREYRIGTHMRPIFRTSDGLLIKPKRDTHDFTRENFEEPMLAWKILPAVEWHGRRFVIGKLPTHDMLYDCSDIDRGLPALLRLAAQAETISLSRKDAQAMVDVIAKTRSQIDPNRGKVIGQNLQAHLENISNLRNIMDEVMKHSRVRAEIEAVKEHAAQDAFKARADLIADATRLKDEIAEIERVMRDKRAELARLPQQVSKQIKNTFDKAVQDGINTLPQVGLLSAFMRPEMDTRVTPDAKTSVIAWTPPAPGMNCSSNTYLAPESVDLVTLLNASGLPMPRVKAMLTAINIALEAGLVIVVAGIVAPTFARKLSIAKTQIQALVKTIDVGASQQQFDAMDLRDSARLWDVVLLQNFNHAPQETYASELFEIALSQLLESPTEHKIQIIATYSKGLAGLPISPGIRKICFVVDLDQKIVPGSTNNIDDWEQALLDSSEDKNQEQPWPIVVRRLVDKLRNYDEPHSDVLALLEAGICSQNHGL